MDSIKVSRKGAILSLRCYKPLQFSIETADYKLRNCIKIFQAFGILMSSAYHEPKINFNWKMGSFLINLSI